MAIDDNELNRPIVIFGRDIRKIPCFRESLLYGIGSGLAGGLIVFMLTSKPRLGSHCAVAIYCCVSLSSFVICRQRWAHQKFSIGQIFSATKSAHTESMYGQDEEKRTIEVTSV